MKSGFFADGMNLDWTSKDILKKLATPFLVLALLMPGTKIAFGTDITFFIQWFTQVKDHGLPMIYAREGANYPPAFMWLLQLLAPFFHGENNPELGIKLLRVSFLFFDFLSIFIVMKSLLRVKINPAWGFILLNPAFLYNCFVWGQCDGIYTSFMLLTLYLILTNRVQWALLAFIVGFNFKIQAIIFVPLIGLSLWSSFRSEIGKVLTGIGLAIAAQIVFLMPFLATGQMANFKQEVVGNVDRYPYLTLNAFNFWLFISQPQEEVHDTITVLGLPAKRLGLILLAISTLAILWLSPWKWLKDRKESIADKSQLASVSLAFGLMPLAFFVWSTQMHERYCHAMMVFFGLYAICTKRWGLFAVSSTTYLLHLFLVHNHISRAAPLKKMDGILWTTPVKDALALSLIGCFFFGLYSLASTRTSEANV